MTEKALYFSKYNGTLFFLNKGTRIFHFALGSANYVAGLDWASLSRKGLKDSV